MLHGHTHLNKKLTSASLSSRGQHRLAIGGARYWSLTITRCRQQADSFDEQKNTSTRSVLEVSNICREGVTPCQEPWIPLQDFVSACLTAVEPESIQH